MCALWGNTAQVQSVSQSSVLLGRCGHCASQVAAACQQPTGGASSPVCIILQLNLSSCRLPPATAAAATAAWYPGHPDTRHLIVRLPGLAFADVCHAGRFARCVLLHLLHQGQHCSKPGALLVLKREGGLTSFVDMGVYTRNR